MVRLLGFFALAYVLTILLGHLPLVGGLFRSTGFLGVWITAIGLSFLISHLGNRAVRSRRDRAVFRELEAVDSPHNHGKLGSLFLAQGRAARALPHLEQAVEGEPDVPEWLYRLGSAYTASGRPQEAIEPLRRCAEIDEEHAYGAALMRLAEAYAASSHPEEALETLRVVERNHGPSPESAYRRGAALKALGRRDEARSAFAEVAALAREAVRYKRKEATLWSLRARMASLF